MGGGVEVRGRQGLEGVVVGKRLLRASCKKQGYCSKGHQRDDWKVHKVSCTNRARSAWKKVLEKVSSNVRGGLWWLRTHIRIHISALSIP